ncbi:MAG: hypothetical protein WBX11_00950 [Thiobacillaceae bacterium]
MSAYIVNPEHVAALAAYAARPPLHRNAVIFEWREGGAELVAEKLMQANIDSCNYRYPNSHYYTPEGEAQLIQEAVEYAKRFKFNAPRLTPLDIIRMCECLDYQSCEPENWRDTLASRQIEFIKSSAIRELPGYDKAVRDFSLAA